MADIRPFRGIRYNLEKLGHEAGRLVSPPYDVIDDVLQQALYDAHPNNVVRIIQGKEEPNDTDAVNKYTRAAADFKRWQDEGDLMRDEDPSLYVYAQHFVAETPNGPVDKTRWGLVGLVRIEPLGDGSVLPHEHTMPGPKADRLELMRKTGGAFGQIFSLYSDPEHRVQALLNPHVAGNPLFAYEDADGVTHQFWRLADGDTIAAIAEILRDKPLFIADGHHRYETSVIYRNERMAADGVTDASDKPYGYGMQTLVNMDDTDGLAVNPIHRVVVDLGADGADRLIDGLTAFFDIETAAFGSSNEIAKTLEARKDGPPVFALYVGDMASIRLLTLKSGVDLVALDADGHSDAWCELDTGLLQMVLGKVLELDVETLIKGEKVRFVKVEADVQKMVDEADDRAGFFLNATTMDQLRAVVLNDERMPPKSTFFYPKVFTGLVMQDLDRF